MLFFVYRKKRVIGKKSAGKVRAQFVCTSCERMKTYTSCFATVLLQEQDEDDEYHLEPGSYPHPDNHQDIFECIQESLNLRDLELSATSFVSDFETNIRQTFRKHSQMFLLKAVIFIMQKPSGHELKKFSNFIGRDILYIPVFEISADICKQYCLIRSDNRDPYSAPLTLLWFEETFFQSGQSVHYSNGFQHYNEALQ